ncbi:carboxypeptidase-like regulatory domain-containing protein [uncultured Croceitalea sp.]|uniref:carboxypeptidase-like regulatory domain-containing protein n=1 Tax=uncultured Croceitalea sp. TaxID=1798908 RepID=UPI003305ADFE
MKPTPFFYVLLVFFFTFSGLSAQDGVYLKGVLKDADTREPVVFATVRIKGKALGVISNQDGGFLIPETLAQEGTVLQVSSMGYETKEIPVSALEVSGISTILLRAAVEQLPETVVTAKRRGRLSARKIIQYALEKIPENYPTTPFGLVGYYRDYQLQRHAYSNLNEAIVAVFDKGFQSDDYKQTQYGMYSYKKNTEFKIDSFAAKPYDYGAQDKIIPNASLISDYGGNELVILHIHDAIRNHNVRAYSFVHKLVEDFVREHRFSSVSQTSYGDEQVYKIRVKKMMLPFRVEGAIYIDKKDFAIRKLDYAVYKKEPDKNPDGPNDYSGEEKLLYEILVEYTKVDGLMYLNYISFHNKFRLIRPPVFRIEEIVLDKDLGYLQIKLNRPAMSFDRLKPSDIRLSYAGQFLKPADWILVDSTEIGLKLNAKQQTRLKDMVYSEKEVTKRPKILLQIEKLVDKDGNQLGERKIDILDQFREFFTQKIMEGETVKPPENKLMLKTKPLYDASQPMLNRKASDSYWMNTPLRKVSN